MSYPNTGAPEWAASQATPWNSVNEAGFIFDAFASRSIVEDRELTTPPVSCANGARYLVDAPATGLWATHDGELAIAIGANASNGWYFAVVALHGVQLFVRDEDLLIEYDGAAWVTAPGGVSVLNDLTDVDAPTPALGDVLKFDGSDWVPSPASAPFSTASTTEQLTGTDSSKGSTPNSVAALWEQGDDVASAATVALGEGGYFVITGTTTITDVDFATDKAGRKAWVKFGGVLTLTHHASTLILPTGANIATAAGDTACFVSEGSDVVRCVAYHRASGAALVGSGGVSDFTDLADVPASYSGQSGKVAAVNATEDGLEFIPAASVTAAADATIDSQFFGDGSDGNVTISSGVTVLTRDMYYHNLTISGTGALDPRGFRIFGAGTLDISAAPAGAIYAGVAAGSRNGTNATQFVGGAGGANSIGSSPTLGNSNTAGGTGATGGTGVGSVASATTGITNSLGFLSGEGGAGGAVGGTGGGASRAAASSSSPRDLRRLNVDLAVFAGTTLGKIDTASGGPGGSSGAGDGTGSGGGGGGGGTGGGVVFLAFRTINRSGSTAAGAISAKGGNGGNGASGNAGTNRGGGGGGSGGGGGWIYLIYRFLTGSTASDCLDATAGNGGAGANGVGTGNGGNGGGAGGTGRIDVYDLGGGTQAITATSGALAGNAASGGTGGAAKTATSQTVTL